MGPNKTWGFKDKPTVNFSGSKTCLKSMPSYSYQCLNETAMQLNETIAADDMDTLNMSLIPYASQSFSC